MKHTQYSNLILDQTKDLVWAVDKNLDLVYANRAYLNLMKEVTGVEKELNTPILVEGFGEGYIEKWKALFLRALSGEGFEIEEHFYNPETQEMQYGQISFSPIRGEGGQILTVACRSTDITPIIRQKDHASRLMDASLDVFCTIDEAGKFVFVSAASAEHWGYRPEELIGTPFRDLIVEDDLEKTDQVAAEIMSGKDFKTFSNRYRKKNGDIAYNLWSVRWGNESKLMYCVARDVKEKIEEEQHLKLLEKVINSTSDAILITEAEPLNEPGPIILYANEAFTKMTGYTAEEVIGKNPRLLQGPDSDYDELKKLGEKLRRWESSEITVLNYTKSGEPFWVNFVVSPVANEKGWFTHWISVQRDVTEQKKQEAEKDLLGQISQSFNNEEELIPAANSLCKNLYSYGKFDLIELWCPNMEQTKINLIGKSDHNHDFYKLEPSETSFKKEKGLPGKVWNKGKQLLWDEKQINKYFVRKKGATHLGLQAILGIPLSFNDELVGVLLIGTKRGPEYLEQHNPVLSRLEKFIGSEINRKRLEVDLKHLYQAIPDILCIADFNGRFLKMNPAGCELLGYKEEEILFHNFDEFVHPEDKDVSTYEVKKLETGANTFQFENRYITKEGKIIWLSWSCNSSVQEGLIYASAKDITAMVQLRELNTQAGTLAKIGSWEIDLEKNTVFWSKIVHQLHETDPNTFTPDLETGINFYREDCRALVQTSIEKSTNTGEGFDFEAVIITEKLKERWVRVIGNVEMLGGKAIRIYGSFQDITDKKESELRLQSFANNLPGVAFQYFIYSDGTDELKYVTDGAKKVWGFDAVSVMKNNSLVWKQIEFGGELDAVKKSIMKSIETKSDWKAQWRYIMPNNEIRIHAGYGSPNFLPDGTVVFNSLILDITEEYRSEELLKQASEMAKIGSWEVNFVNKNTLWSDLTHQLHETDPASFVPDLEKSIEFYREDFRNMVRSHVQACIEDGKPFDFEAVIVTAKNNERWIRVIGRAEMINEQCQRIHGSFQDIHNLKIVEQQKNILLATIENSLNEIYVFDAQTLKFISVNKGALINLGYSETEILELTPLHLKPEFTASTFNKLVTPLVAKEKEKIIFFTNHKRKNGSLYPVEVHLQFIEEGNNKRFLAIILDITKRKKSETSLLASLKSLEDYKFALDQTAIITMTDTKGVITSVNDQFCKISKFSKEELIGKTHKIVNSGYHPESFFAELWKTIAQGKVFRAEIKNQAKDGSYYWVDSTIVPFLDENNKPFQYLAIRIDITAKKLANEKIIEILEEKNNILESIGDAFFAVDKDWIVTYWNKQAEIILGRNKEDVIGKNIWEAYPDAIDSDFYRQYHKAMSTGETINFEEYYITLDMWIEVTVYPSDSGLSIYFKDITLRKKADIRLLKANERFELVTKATNDAIWDWDIENDDFYRSDNIHKIFGSNASTKLNKNQFWQDSFYSEDLGKLKESIQNALNDPQSERWELEYRVLNDNNEELSVIDRGIIVRDKNGKAIRMVGAMTDLTKQKRLEKEMSKLNESLKTYAKELERSNEELEQFAFITSHDLQEPLRMISSFMDQLKRKYADQLDDKALQYIHYATDGAKRMKQIILDLLLYSRANKPSEQLEEVNLNEILTDYTQLRRRVINEKKASIKFDLLPVLRTYRAPITQIVHCLLDNALKYVKENEPPYIEVHAKEKEAVWEFAVKDNGIGIDEKFYDKIFIIFQRLHNRNQHDGTGIGLSIAKRGVEFLGGEIWLESNEGQGSTFYFTIGKK